MAERDSNLTRLQELLVVVSVAALALLAGALNLPRPVDSLEVAVADVNTAISLARLEAVRERRAARVELDSDGKTLVVRRPGESTVLHRLHLAPAVRASAMLDRSPTTVWGIEFDGRGSPVGSRPGLLLSAGGLVSRIDVAAPGRARGAAERRAVLR